jgi:hypothetical protein
MDPSGSDGVNFTGAIGADEKILLGQEVGQERVFRPSWDRKSAGQKTPLAGKPFVFYGYF